MNITIGSIVLYNTTKEDRKAAKDAGSNERAQLPALIVHADNDKGTANLRVIHDGDAGDDYMEAVAYGTAEGQWQ